MIVLPLPVGATRMMRRLLFARAIKLGDDVASGTGAARSCGTRSRARIFQAGARAAGSSRATERSPSSLTRPLRWQASIRRSTTSRIIELAAGDQLKQSESRAVERAVARAGQRGGEARDLGIERGPAIGI